MNIPLEQIGVIASLVVGTIGALVGALSWVTSARKTRVDSLSQIVDRVDGENERLMARVSVLERWKEMAEDYIDTLIRQLRDNNIEPARPPWDAPEPERDKPQPVNRWWGLL